MQHSILFLISSDPRTSGRPAEAVRIAAGIAVWKKAAVSICFCGQAILALSELAEDWPDGDNYSRYLPLLTQSGRPLYTANPGDFLSQIEPSNWRYENLSDPALARLAARTQYIAHF